MLSSVKEIAMGLRGTAIGLILAGLVAGCTTTPKEQPIVTADSGTLARVRNDLQRMDPTALVGQVDEVQPDKNTASIGNIPTADIKEGDIVTFLDGNQKALTTGKVIRVLPESLHVRYEAPLTNGRPPVVGDLAVRFK